MQRSVSQTYKQSVRIVSLTLVVWTSSGLFQGILGKSHRVKNQPVIKVGVYNYAGVARREVRLAECQAAALMAVANVRIAWSEYSGNRLSIPSGNPVPDFSIRILPASMARRGNYKPEALGESVVPSGSRGPLPRGTANVFYARVKHVASLWGLFPGDVLGDAMVHELGHLLLGSRHSREGIMKAHWTFRDLELASRSKLRFSARQAAALQRAARSLQRNGSVRLAAIC